MVDIEVPIMTSITKYSKKLWISVSKSQLDPLKSRNVKAATRDTKHKNPYKKNNEMLKKELKIAGKVF